jgi:hypothetical protein
VLGKTLKFPGYLKTLAKFELMDGAPVRGKPKI